MISDPVVTDAVISDCGRFRYLLTRRFASVDGPAVTFIMLNPSTADAANDDPTIRRCMAYAQRWGHGSLFVVNLFALRSTSSREISECAGVGVDPRGPDNLLYVRRACSTGEVVCAWGNHGAFEHAGARMIEWLRDQGVTPLALRMTKAGHPAHPLYLPGDLQPLPL
jgi:hypothetical protein